MMPVNWDNEDLLINREERVAIMVIDGKCSEEDAQIMRDTYGPQELRVMPNGIDARAIRFVTPKERIQIQQALGKDPQRWMALFMGSDHAPNREAVNAIVAVAPQCPEIDFVVMGSVCKCLEGQSLPSNVRCTGLVSDAEKAQYLAMADIGLNPMKGGSGTNLKMAEYAAAGLWMVSTEYGARGFWDCGVHYTPVSWETLASDLNVLPCSHPRNEKTSLIKPMFR